MKKLAIVLGASLMLSACATTGIGGGIDPGPPPEKEIVIKEVPVPVVCKNEVTKPQIDIDGANPEAPLEEQNSILRSTIAQLMVYVNDLRAGFEGCGGKVK